MEVHVHSDDSRQTSPASVTFASMFDSINVVWSTNDHDTDEENNGNRAEQHVPIKPDVGTVPTTSKWKHGLFSFFQAFFPF